MTNKSSRINKSQSERRRKISRLGLLFIVLFLVGMIGAAYLIFNQKSTNSPDGSNLAMITTTSGLKYQEIVVGTGQQTKLGDTVIVNYTAWLTNGTKINSSLDSGQPYEFLLGSSQVIPGFKEGVIGMRVGGKRKLTVPPNLAFGELGASQIIGPNATLFFEVELIGIK